jgi:hypothetical protein
MSPNFALLDLSHPDVVRLVAAMLQARDAVERRSWSHPQEPTREEWWADVLADPRARKRERRTDLAVKQAFYRLADEKREIILVACSKCDWRAAFARDDLIAAHGVMAKARAAIGETSAQARAAMSALTFASNTPHKHARRSVRRISYHNNYCRGLDRARPNRWAHYSSSAH